jgi:hypothetical protein
MQNLKKQNKSLDFRLENPHNDRNKARNRTMNLKENLEFFVHMGCSVLKAEPEHLNLIGKFVVGTLGMVSIMCGVIMVAPFFLIVQPIAILAFVAQFIFIKKEKRSHLNNYLLWK